MEIYQLESILGQLAEEKGKDNDGKPQCPEGEFIQTLNAQDAKQKAELVKGVIPKLLFDPLQFHQAQFTEDPLLDVLAAQSNRTVDRIDQNLNTSSRPMCSVQLDELTSKETD